MAHLARQSARPDARNISPQLSMRMVLSSWALRTMAREGGSQGGMRSGGIVKGGEVVKGRRSNGEEIKAYEWHRKGVLYVMRDMIGAARVCYE